MPNLPKKFGYARHQKMTFDKAGNYVKGSASKQYYKPKVVAPFFDKRVKAVVRRQQETKFKIGPPTNFNTNATLEQFTAFTSGITSTNEIYNLIPDVAVGDDDHQRVGNVIQPVSLTTKVNLVATSSTSMSVWADVYFLHSKTVKDFKLTNGIQTGQLMNAGDGTNVPYDGTSYTAMLPINKSEFTVIAHKHILLQKGNLDPNSALSGSATPASDTFSFTKSFSQKIDLPQKLFYEARSQVQPTNTYPFMVVGFYGTDTNGNTAPITARISVQAQSHMYYKDA